MTEIEKKALALVNEARSLCRTSILSDKMARDLANELERAIERHEAFRQEVSDAVEDYCGYVPPDSPCHPITRFIIAKPDPLVEVCREIGLAPYRPDELRAAIEKRGGKIVWEDK